MAGVWLTAACPRPITTMCSDETNGALSMAAGILAMTPLRVPDAEPCQSPSPVASSRSDAPHRRDILSRSGRGTSRRFLLP